MAKARAAAKTAEKEIDFTSGASLPELIEMLSSDSRRQRQNAASEISSLATTQAKELVAYADTFIECLDLSEARTRWDCLDVLSALCEIDAGVCAGALAGAETALFDEQSGPLRLAAYRFMCAYGATSEERSLAVWSLVDEATQCCHGDPEFQDMMIALIRFAGGSLDAQVKTELVQRMDFDAKNNRGATQLRAQKIIDILSAK